MRKWVTCPDCKGLGKKDGKTCPRCNGKFNVPESDVVSKVTSEVNDD